MIYTTHCRRCGSPHEIDITKEQVQELILREKKIQDILPSPKYTAEDREMFLSKLCDGCWNLIFPPEDDDVTSAEMELSGGCPDLEN
jgi:hypothetical protein